MNRYRTVIIGGAIVLLLIATAVIVMLQQPSINTPPGNNGQPAAPEEPPASQEPAPSPEEPPVDNEDETVDESHDLVYIQNMDPLFDIFSSQQALYINDTVVNYTLDNYGKFRISISDGQIQNRGGEAFGFNIINSDDNEHLFYVIATKLSDGNVRVDFY